MKYAMWYDNGSGYLEGHKLVEAIRFDSYPYRQVATAGWERNPNEDERHILAESGDATSIWEVQMVDGLDRKNKVSIQAKDADTAMTAMFG